MKIWKTSADLSKGYLRWKCVEDPKIEIRGYSETEEVTSIPNHFEVYIGGAFLGEGDLGTWDEAVAIVRDHPLNKHIKYHVNKLGEFVPFSNTETTI